MWVFVLTYTVPLGTTLESLCKVYVMLILECGSFSTIVDQFQQLTSLSIGSFMAHAGSVQASPASSKRRWTVAEHVKTVTEAGQSAVTWVYVKFFRLTCIKMSVREDPVIALRGKGRTSKARKMQTFTDAHEFFLAYCSTEGLCVCL